MADASSVSAAGDPDPALITLVELFFFAYRDFTGEADAVLAEFGLGRAHHRALHFVKRHPGLRVGDLLGILKITKQSLARVLKPLIEARWIESRPGPDDRRERLLYVTPAGSDLVERLARRQMQRIAAALAASRQTGHHRAGADPETVRRFLFAMIGAEERAGVEHLIATANRHLGRASS